MLCQRWSRHVATMAATAANKPLLYPGARCFEKLSGYSVLGHLKMPVCWVVLLSNTPHLPRWRVHECHRQKDCSGNAACRNLATSCRSACELCAVGAFYPGHDPGHLFWADTLSLTLCLIDVLDCWKDGVSEYYECGPMKQLKAMLVSQVSNLSSTVVDTSAARTSIMSG